MSSFSDKIYPNGVYCKENAPKKGEESRLRLVLGSWVSKLIDLSSRSCLNGADRKENVMSISENSNGFKTYVCNLCGWSYNEEAGDPDNGIAPGTKWEDLPVDFVCPLCGASKDEFTAQ